MDYGLTLEELNKQIAAYNNDPRVKAYREQKAAAEQAARDEWYRVQRAEREEFEQRVKAFNEARRQSQR